MRMLILGLLISSVVACTHSAVNYEKAPPQEATYLKPGDREPAQSPDLAWTPATVKVNVSGNASAPVQTITVNQEMTWTELETVMENRTAYREFETPGICSDFDCSKGAGNSAAWNAYFSAAKDKKAAALSKAIQGIGEVSSEALVAKGYFRAKPRSWNEFAAEIQKAAANGVIKKSVATTVVGNYKYENIETLGYTAGACREVTRPCTLTISKLVPIQVPVQVKKQKKRIVQTKQFNVQVTIENTVLLKDEVDRLSLRINENGEVSALDVDGFNRYSLANRSLVGQNLHLNIASTGRVLRQLPNNVVRQDSYSLIGDKATFVLDVDSKYIPSADEDPNAQLVIDYTVKVCEYGWTGTCGFSSWKNLSMNSAVISDSRLVIAMDIPAKHKSEIEYSVSRKNSRFFNDKATSVRATENVKMAR